MRQFRLLKVVLPVIAAVTLQAPAACAQAPVVDRSPDTSSSRHRNDGNNGGADSAARAANAELFSQLQELQQEVRDLRGKVEEQAHEIQQLDRKRLQDYQNLDKRITQLQKQGGGAAPAPSGLSGAGAAAPVTIGAGSGNDRGSKQELNDYRAAYDLLKNQKIDQAEKAFEKYVKDYPKSQFAGNAYYWLGKLYLIDGTTDSARDSFERLINKYPGNRKVPDATFELAKLYYQAGKRDQAKKLLDKVINDYSDAAATTAELARAYRDKYFGK